MCAVRDIYSVEKLDRTAVAFARKERDCLPLSQERDLCENAAR